MQRILTITSLLLIISIKASTQGNTLNFDGGNDGVDLNTTLLSSSNPTQPYTLEAWIKAPSQGGSCIICQHFFPGENRFQFMISSDKLRWEKGNSSSPVGISSTTTIGDDQWHHVAATRDATGNVILYVDGVQDGTGTDNLPFYGSTTNIGERILTNGGHFLGNIDEVRIWSGARTQGEIQSTMNQELVGNETGLIAYYNFNQGTAGGNNSGLTTLIDANGNNGTLNDFALIGATSNWISSSFPLPVELIEFRGFKDEKAINLQWKTASELNNSGFEIEKSNDGKEWNRINFIDGNGTATKVNDYQYQDTNPFSGLNYYRLKQIDFDGAFEYSKVIAINFSKERELQFYPNPVSDKFQIVGIEEGEIVIMDYMGKTILQTNFKGSEIDISELANGIYFVKVSSKNQIWTKRLIKE
jgi:hypothetical protein